MTYHVVDQLLSVESISVYIPSIVTASVVVLQNNVMQQ